MTHLAVLPVVLPALAAAFILLLLRYRRRAAGRLCMSVCIGLVGVAIALTAQASGGEISSYALGNWPAPFGIVLVVDRLSAGMLLLTSLLATFVLWHALSTGLERRGWHFLPLFMFQLLGLNGAFLTGDLFNLFVFFEVLLIASYGLMLHGQGEERLRAGVQYVVINLVGSTLFLIAIGLLYGATGTLNMADMGARIAGAPESELGLIRAGATLLTVVFALKAAVFPLHLWLPRTYSRTSMPVATLFAILTKVGVYAIIRTSLLVFPASGGDSHAVPWLLPLALLTAITGYVGIAGARGLRELAAFGVIGSTGTLMAAVAVFSDTAIASALYYLPHSTIAGALLFLITDLIVGRRGAAGDRLVAGPRLAGAGALAALFMLIAIANTGLPPLSGFLGKLLILDGVRGADGWRLIWAVVLGTTLIGVLGFARAGSSLFWERAEPVSEPHAVAVRSTFFPVVGLLALLVAMTIFADVLSRYAADTAAQLAAPRAYPGVGHAP